MERIHMKLRTLVLHVAAGITLGLTAAPAISQGYQAEVTKQRLCNHMGLTAQRAYLMKSKGLPKETDFGTPSHIDPLIRFATDSGYEQAPDARDAHAVAWAKCMDNLDRLTRDYKAGWPSAPIR
jgi:hypothetical protein